MLICNWKILFVINQFPEAVQTEDICFDFESQQWSNNNNNNSTTSFIWISNTLQMNLSFQTNDSIYQMYALYRFAPLTTFFMLVSYMAHSSMLKIEKLIPPTHQLTWTEYTGCMSQKKNSLCLWTGVTWWKKISYTAQMNALKGTLHVWYLIEYWVDDFILRNYA
jgi:hypothetical protein